MRNECYSLKPSTADIEFTEKVIAAGKAIDIDLVDRIIYPENRHLIESGPILRFEAFA